MYNIMTDMNVEINNENKNVLNKVIRQNIFCYRLIKQYIQYIL